VMDVAVCSREDGVARWCRSYNGGCRLQLPWWPEVVRRFALAVCDGFVGGVRRICWRREGWWNVKCGGRRRAAVVRTKRMVVVEVLRRGAVVCDASRWSETAAAAVEVDGGG